MICLSGLINKIDDEMGRPHIGFKRTLVELKLLIERIEVMLKIFRLILVG